MSETPGPVFVSRFLPTREAGRIVKFNICGVTDVKTPVVIWEIHPADTSPRCLCLNQRSVVAAERSAGTSRDADLVRRVSEKIKSSESKTTQRRRRSPVVFVCLTDKTIRALVMSRVWTPNAKRLADCNEQLFMFQQELRPSPAQ